MASKPAPSAASQPDGPDIEAEDLATPPLAPARPSLFFLDGASTRLRNFIFNMAFVGVLLMIVPVLGSQFFRNEVLIEPISVPEQLVQRGLTPDVVASRLWDGLRDAKALAGTNRTALSATPEQQVQFAVPKVGLSIDSIVQQTRQFLNVYETRISGEFVCADAACTPEQMRLRLRVVRATSDVIDLPAVGEKPLRDYFTQAAIQILSVVDPYIAAAAIIEVEPVRGTALLRRLIRQQHPDAKWAYNFLGLRRWMDEDYEGALAEYRAAIALDANFYLPHINAGNVLMELGRTDEARAEYALVEAQDPGNALAVIGNARLYDKLGEQDKAITLLESVAQRDPSNPEYTYLMGDIEQRRGNIAAAKAYYMRSLQIDPSYGLALTPMFTQVISEGNLLGGEELLRAAADFRPNDADILSMHGVSLVFLNRSAEALDAFQRALVMQPDNAELMQQIAGQMQNLDMQAEAVSMLDRAIALDPYNASLFLSRGTSLALTQRNAEARRDFERVLELDTPGTNQADLAANFIKILDDLAAADKRDAAAGKATAPDTAQAIP